MIGDRTEHRAAGDAAPPASTPAVSVYYFTSVRNASRVRIFTAAAMHTLAGRWTASSPPAPRVARDPVLQACALDCSGGKVCPAPMQCYDLDGVGMVCG